LLSGASIAAAQDLTGSWEGQAVCTGFFNGAKFKDTFGNTLLISQSGADINMEFLGVRYNAALIVDNKNPTKAEGPFIACSTQAEPFGDFNEVGHMKVQVDEVKDKTSFKAESIFTVGEGVVATCKWSFERIDVANPNVLGCGGDI
jgi:hypothetical protein